MGNNRLYIALGVMVLLLGATFFVYRRPEDTSERVRNPWPTFDRAQVTRVAIQRPNNAPAIELEKRDNHWVMTAPAQGPADETAVSNMVRDVAELNTLAVAAHSASSHADLGVDAAHAQHLQMWRGSTLVFDGWVGRNLDQGMALRYGTAPDVYRVDHSLIVHVTKEPREWRDRNVTALEREHVRSVEWHNARGTWRFDRNNDTWTAAAGNPAIERLDTARVNTKVGNLLALRATDFAAADVSHGITNDSPRVTLTVDNGQPVVLRVGSRAGASEVYLRREGSDIVYTVGQSQGEDIDLDPASLQAPLPAGDAGARTDASAAAPAPAAAGDGGMPSLPPGAMEQIRRMMQQRGLQPPH